MRGAKCGWRGIYGASRREDWDGKLKLKESTVGAPRMKMERLVRKADRVLI